MKINRLLRSLALLVFLFSQDFYPQSQHINQSRGFNANGVYSSKDIDNINLFNGNLTLTIPIGGSYKGGGNSTFSLMLVYNSNLWNQEEQCAVQATGKYTVWSHFSFETQNVWVDPPYPNANDGELIAPREDDDCYTISVPNPETNAGMGWQLTLGKLFPPRAYDYHPLATEKQNWVYVAPDGSEHSFYNKLHETDSETDANVTYTRDGSYLRMKAVAGGERIVEFPNGDVHRFSNSGNPDWRLTRMEDQFGNYFAVTYENRDGNNAVDWVIKDKFDREQIIYFHKPSLAYQAVVDSVKLTGFGGAPSVYDFEYGIKQIKRAAPHVADQQFSAEIIVPFLTAVKLPDNSSYQMPVETSYDITPDAQFSNLKSRGIIRAITLPTGGRMEWDYKESVDNPDTPLDETKLYYGYPIISSTRAYKRRSTGVRRRRVIESGSTHTWTYAPMPEPAPAPDDANCPYNTLNPACLPKEFVNKVTTPEGHYTLHYFSMYPALGFSQQGRSLTEWHIAEYALPITKAADDPEKRKTDDSNKPLFLSEQVYEKKGDNYDLSRSTYLRYETDEVPYLDGYGNVIDTNRRVVAQRTVYNNDGDSYAEVRYSNFDGLGHYRQTDTSGNFKAGDFTTAITNYNPNNCKYIINPATNTPDYSQGHCYADFPTTSDWVLGTYDSTVKIENNVASQQLFHFDASGQLLRKRIFKNFGTGAQNPGIPDAKDIVIRYGYANGDLLTEEIFGGDNKSLSTNESLAAMNLSNSEYTTHHTYQYGVLNSSQIVGADFKSLDLDIDKFSGLAAQSRDQSGDYTNYLYDGLGRVTDTTPRQGSATKILYEKFNPASGALANITVQHLTNSGATKLDEEKYFYDHLGRISSERQLMPGGTATAPLYMEKVTTYTGSGWTKTVSEWGSAAQKTTFDLYDPFGRSQKIISPDNKISWLTYKGDRQIKKEVNIATSYAAEELVATTETYDRQGRLSIVEEDSDYTSVPNSPRALKTFYTYDVGNRLKKVTSNVAGTVTRPNVAAATSGAVISASSTVNPNYPASGANDGDRTGRLWEHGGGWADGSQGVYSTDWVRINFGAAKSIKEIDVYTLRVGYATKTGDPTANETFNNADNGNQGIIDFDVQYLSNNGWKNVPGGQIVGNDKVWRKLTFNPVTTTAIRVAVHKAVVWTNIPNNFSRIVEIEAYDTSSVNVARQSGATVEASSQHRSGNFPAAAVVDGDRRGFNWGNPGYGGGWNDDTEGVYASDWLQIDFGANRNIEEIDVFTLPNNWTTGQQPTLADTFPTADNAGQGITYFEVQFWDGARWRTAPNALIKNNNNVWRKLTFSSPLNTRFIRVVVRDAAVWTNIANNYSRIVEVEAYEAATVSSGSGQVRQFNYDGRGFLTSETHPELGAAGNGTIQYPNYDSKGNLGHKIDGANQLKYFYDVAGRIDRVEESCGGAGRPCVGTANNWQVLKKFTYYKDADNIPGQLYRAGKLTTATRHNYIINPNSGSPVDVTYSESYDYWGMDGRLSHRTTSSSLGVNYQQTFAYDQLGNLASQTYPICAGNNFCAQSNAAASRKIINTYSNGLLTKVASEQNNYAKKIDYNFNGTVKTIEHGVSGDLSAAGVTDNYLMDSDFMQRVKQISTSGVAYSQNWNSGEYKYDGAGNIKRINTDWYIYDRVNRLVEGTSLAPWKKKQTYTYDPFGNMTKKDTYQNVTAYGTGTLSKADLYGTNPSTNRFNSIAYDASGNLTFGIYGYDSLNMMKTYPGRINLYNASDERVHVYDYSSGNPATYRDTITLRGLNNEVLREYQVDGGNAAPANWSWVKDYIYAGTKLLSSEGKYEGRRNYHPDHLGSPRLITNNNLIVDGSNPYLPFGDAAGGATNERLDFTGHEKDMPTSAGGHPLLYMHARFYSAANGKFLSVDPGRDWEPKQPQSWNMYAYVRNNPLNSTDPTGKDKWTCGPNDQYYTELAGAAKQSEINRQDDSIEDKTYDVMLNFVPGGKAAKVGGVGIMGGAYKKVLKGGGREAHHLLSWRVIKQAFKNISKDNAAAVSLFTKIHRRTASWGSGKAADIWTRMQLDLIESGRVRTAIYNEVREIRRLEGSGANEGLKEALQHLRDIGILID
ncbi:MAG TPA: discoidin domain-containing protein [Pyrinomonadaceae bacterium]